MDILQAKAQGKGSQRSIKSAPSFAIPGLREMAHALMSLLEGSAKGRSSGRISARFAYRRAIEMMLALKNERRTLARKSAVVELPPGHLFGLGCSWELG